MLAVPFDALVASFATVVVSNETVAISFDALVVSNETLIVSNEMVVVSFDTLVVCHVIWTWDGAAVAAIRDGTGAGRGFSGPVFVAARSVRT